MSDSFLLFDNEAKDQINEHVLPLFADKVLLKAWENESPAEFNTESRVYAYVSDEYAPAVIEAAIKGGWFQLSYLTPLLVMLGVVSVLKATFKEPFKLRNQPAHKKSMYCVVMGN